MELPVIGTPKTPGTPATPLDITIQRGSSPVEPITFTACQELAKTVRQCSQSLIEGSWVDIPDVRGKKPRFIPNNFESAKAFLRSSLSQIESRVPLRSRSATPVTSHSRPSTTMGVCHQCHGPIGDGAHQGSAFGKGVCSFNHSHFCRGGVPENDSWAPCPQGYSFNPDLDLASGPGFESTLGVSNFQNGPTSSTPALANNNAPTVQQQFPLTDSVIPAPPGTDSVQDPYPMADHPQTTGDRYPGVMTGDWRRLEYPPSDPDTRVPGIVSLEGGAADGATGGVPENIQHQIESHRAVNQNNGQYSDRPYGDLEISTLRRDPALRVDVENMMETVIRQRIPSLSAADTAHVHDGGIRVTPVHDDPDVGIRVFSSNTDQQFNGARPKNSNPITQNPLPAQQNGQQQQQIRPPAQALHLFPQQQPGHQQSGQPVQAPAVSQPHTGHQQHPRAQGGGHTGQVQQQLSAPYGAVFTVQPPVMQQHPPAHGGHRGHAQAAYHGQSPVVSQPHPADVYHDQQPQVLQQRYGQQPQQVQHLQILPQPQGHGFPRQHGQQMAQSQPLRQGPPALQPARTQQLAGHLSQHAQLQPGQAPRNAMHSQGYGQPQPGYFPSQPVQGQQLGYSHQAPGHFVQSPGSVPQHQPVSSASSGQDPYCYEWATDSTGKQVLVRLPHTPQATHSPQQQVSTPPQSFRLEFRCSPRSGRQWQIQVPVSPLPSNPIPKPCYEWRIHPHTGDRYQVVVPTPQVGAPPRTSGMQMSRPMASQGCAQPQQPRYAQQQLSGQQYSTQTASPNVTHLLNNSSNQQQQQQLPQQLPAQVHDHSRSEMSRNERVAGIVSLLEGGAGGSTRNVPKVLEFAKKCPTKWSKQATLSNINLPLYAWGVVEEVESALSGRSQAMEPGTILGKLRHLKNSLEICCQNSSSSEFGGYGWNLAKDYATKLTEEIDQGRSSWQDVQLEVKTSTLMSATMENPRPPLRQDPPPKGAKGEGGRGKPDDKKDLCTTYNKCQTEYKCEFEVSNPGRTCFKKHECNWCRTKKNQSWKHQELRCKNKLASGVE